MQQSAYKLSVHRRKRSSTRFLQILMGIFGACFLFAGVAFDRGMMLPCFLMAALYFIFEFFSQKTYTYVLRDNLLDIEVIYGGRFDKPVRRIDIDRLVVLAPHDDPAVDAYRKGAASGNLKKYDYTSYDDSIPYYTMIVDEAGMKVKYLLDLSDEMIRHIRLRCPQKVAGF